MTLLPGRWCSRFAWASWRQWWTAGECRRLWSCRAAELWRCPGHSNGLKNLMITSRGFPTVNLAKQKVRLTLNLGLMVCGLKLTLRMGMSPETERTSACVCRRASPPCVINSHLLRRAWGIRPTSWWMWFSPCLQTHGRWETSTRQLETLFKSVLNGQPQHKLTVFSQHYHNFWVGELSFFDLEGELAHRLLHFWILKTSSGWI